MSPPRSSWSRCGNRSRSNCSPRSISRRPSLWRHESAANFGHLSLRRCEVYRVKSPFNGRLDGFVRLFPILGIIISCLFERASNCDSQFARLSFQSLAVQTEWCPMACSKVPFELWTSERRFLSKTVQWIVLWIPFCGYRSIDSIHWILVGTIHWMLFNKKLTVRPIPRWS